jgi:nucleoside-diphosphate-sugar epimerase
MGRIVIAGCGYVGSALGTALASDGHAVFGVRRDPSRLPPGISPIAADLSQRESPLVLPEGLDFAVYCASPDSADAVDYRRTYLDGLELFLRTLRDQGEKPRRIFFTSSTSVYAQERGEWIDEESPARPSREAAATLLLAESLLGASGFPSTVVRFAGIYGPGRTRLIEQVARGESLTGTVPHYTNRIHRDDAAGMLRHLMRVESPEPLLLGVDSDPADEAEILHFLAKELGVDPPRTQQPADPPARRRSGSKRCRNDRMLETGYVLRVPSFRAGYPPIVRAWRASGADEPLGTTREQ